MVSKKKAEKAFNTLQNFCVETECYTYGCPFKRDDDTCIMTQRDDGINGDYYPENWDIENK